MRKDKEPCLKKWLSNLPLFLFLLHCILPFFRIVGWILGYDFVLYSDPLCSTALAAIFFIGTIFLFVFQKSLSIRSAVFSALLLPMSLVSGICFLSQHSTKLIAVCALIDFVCAIAVFSKFSGPLALKIISGILSVLFFFALLLVSFAEIMRSNTVVKSVSSPSNQYVAEVIDNDQGALGGNTWVHVKDKSRTVNLLIGKFSKHPILVYTGRWGEFTDMQISWESERALLINGKRYDLSGKF
ncbi:MAG: DUF5412 domain-containing protein [Oscillospiraceae bacterium]|jgi:hypothetical protein|nr:DUF5412 domain-containing protein [Oscillospiraceae bacterium]